MKIIICAIPAILAAVAMTGPFRAPDNAAAQPEHAGAAPQIQPAAEPEPEPQLELRLAEQPSPAPTLAAAPRWEPGLAEREPSGAADGEWQVVRQRRPDAARDVRPPQPLRSTADAARLAEEHEAQREALLQQQARQIEQVLERQRLEYEELLEQQEQASAAAGRERDTRPVELQAETQAAELPDHFNQRDPLAPQPDFPQSSVSGGSPRPDPVPDDGSYHPESVSRSADAVREDVRPSERDRRDAIEIPLPGRRVFRFRLW